MRVVLVSEAAGGGVGKHVLDLAEHLPRRGFEVLLVHSTSRIEEDFRVRVARNCEHGYQVARVDVDRAPGPRDAIGTWQLRRVVREFGGADVLHGHSAKGGALARLARWGRARRVFYTPHAFYTQAPTLSAMSRRIFALAEYGLSFATDRLIATSNDEARLARSLGIPERKVTVVENGIEIRSDAELASVRAAVRRALGIGDEEVLVGFVGRLVPQKAPVKAVEVFQRLAQDSPNARFLLVGDGPEAPAVSQAIGGDREHALRVHWLRTGVGRDLVPAMDVLVVTSHYEGFPYVMLEALDAGCAIVTTSVGGAADCVINGRNGVIVESASADALASAVRGFVNCPERLSAARGASRAQARRFEIGRMLDRLTTLYRSDTRDAA
jgi:glycosyltransferase involved in cell wall biosynthesis